MYCLSVFFERLLALSVNTNLLAALSYDKP